MSTAKTPGLSNEEVTRLIEEYRRTKDKSVRDIVITAYEGIAGQVAASFVSTHGWRDLKQEAMVGIMKAFDTYDPKKTASFSTWAWRKADGEVRHFLRDVDKLMKVPAWSQEVMTKVRKAQDRLTSRLFREPTIREIAEEVGMSEHRVLNAIRAKMLNLNLTSINAKISSGYSENKTWEDVLYDPDERDSFAAADTAVDVHNAVAQLPEKQRQFVELYLQTDQGQGSCARVAREMGISMNYASYLRKKAFEELRRRLGDDGDR